MHLNLTVLLHLSWGLWYERQLPFRTHKEILQRALCIQEKKLC